MKNSSLAIAFFAGFALTIGLHVYETSAKYPRPSYGVLENCKFGNFHPDCSKKNVYR